MARLNKPPSDDLLQEAVEWRMGGFKWEVVAAKVKRAVNTVRKWPVRYAERWEAAIERAERRLSVDSNAESVLVLRNLLRADDLKLRWQAAKTLVGLRVDLGKLGLRLLATRTAAGLTNDPTADPNYQLYHLLQQRSDRELSHLVESLGLSAANGFPTHGPVGHARDSAKGGIEATCAAEPAGQK